MTGQDVNSTNESQEKASVIWRVKILAGAMVGSSWPITRDPLIVGRGLGCQVYIDHPAVSRMQCNISLENKRPYFKHLSERNHTLLNGKVCNEAELSSGDILEFCGFELTIQKKSAGESIDFLRTTGKHTTQHFSDSTFLNQPTEEETPIGFSTDLVGLYSLLRTLAKSESIETLISELLSHLQERFGQDSYWICWGESETSELIFYPPMSNVQMAAAPTSTMKDTIATELGILSSDQKVLSVPLVHAIGTFGAIAARRKSGRAPYTQIDLHYLLALAEGASPIILAAERLEQLQRDLKDSERSLPDRHRMLGNSQAIQELQQRLDEASKTTANVLILGETGVGKELAARSIHDRSSRASGPYVAINCATLSDSLFESEFFGHKEGAFTGASYKRKGLYEQAHRGTLFLDELGELSPLNQARLLRVVEARTFRPVGSEEDISVDVRIISATNRALPDSSEVHLRIDLYYRLSGISIWVPPLRERKEDIPALADHFIGKFGPHSPSKPNCISEKAIEKLACYHWPGNIRELRSVIERGCYSCSDRTIVPENILLMEERSAQVNASESQSLKQAEHEQLLKSLLAYDYNVAKAASSLGIAPSTLYYKLRRHGISLRKSRH